MQQGNVKSHRGRYGKGELQELGRFAGNLGIEMIPCIQTLAHLEHILQWPAYASLRDSDRVILADHEPTYALLERMIAAASAPFIEFRKSNGDKVTIYVA